MKRRISSNILNVHGDPYVIESFFREHIIPNVPFDLLELNVNNATKSAIAIVEVNNSRNFEKFKRAAQKAVKSGRLECFKELVSSADGQSNVESPAEWGIKILTQKANRAEFEHQVKMKELDEKLIQLELKVPALNFDVYQEQLAVKSVLEESVAQLGEFTRQKEGYFENLKNCKSKNECQAILKDFGCEVTKFRNALPIYSKRTEIKRLVVEHRVCVVVADTGSGKSTQIPQYLSEVFSGRTVICTQPRKVAALSLAQRVAEEMAVNLGNEVGYRTGLNCRYRKNSKIVYMVDATLLRECLKDRLLSDFSCVVVDEAHERSLSTDIVLGMLKHCLRVRPDFKVIVTSATIDPHLFVKYFEEFGPCPILQVPGRKFPVEIRWADKPCDRKGDFVKDVVESVKRICRGNESGDVLAFLTTPAETELASNMLLKDHNPAIHVLQLHGRLQPKDQDLVFQPTAQGKRKVVFATNSAETSVTIDGVTFVVDCGFVKERKFDPVRGTSSLEVGFISKSSAKQRSGRAGRTKPGICIRLYDESDYVSMAEMFVPEILRVNLGQTLLYLLSMNIEDPLNFDFIEKPSEHILHKAFDLLAKLGAVDSSTKKLTELGRQMSKIPLEPRLSKFILSPAVDKDILNEAVIMASCVSVGNLFYRMGTEEQKTQADVCKLSFASDQGDALTYLNVFNQWAKQHQHHRGRWCADNFINGKCLKAIQETVKEIRGCLTKELKMNLPELTYENEIDSDKVSHLMSAYCAAFSDNLAIFSGHQRAGYFSPAVDEYVFVHPGSSLNFGDVQCKWIVFEYILKTTKSYAFNVLTVNDNWLNHESNLQQLVDKCVKKILVTVDLNVFGAAAKRLILSNRENLLALPPGEPCILDCPPKDPWFRVNLFCGDRYQLQLKNKAKAIVADLLTSFQNEYLEKANHRSASRICIEAGGKTSEILMPTEYRTVVVSNVSYSQSSVEDVKSVLGRFGTVLICVKYKNNPKAVETQKWGFVGFSSTTEAAMAMSSANVKLPFVLTPKVPQKRHFLESDAKNETFPILISWCRRPSQKIGFVTFENAVDVSDALMLLSRHMNAKMSKKNAFSEIFVNNLNPQWSTRDFESHVREVLDRHGITFTKAFVVLKKSFETSDEELLQYAERLRDHVRSVASIAEDDFVLELDKPKSHADVEYRGHIRVPAVRMAVRVLHYLKMADFFCINSQLVKFEADVRMNIMIPTRIYDVMMDAFEDFKKYVTKKYSTEVVRFQVVHLKNGRINAQITGTDYPTALTVKALFEEQIRGDDISCQNGIVKILLTQVGEQFFKSLEKELGIFVMSNMVRQEIRLYGSEKHRTLAKTKINNFLDVRVGKSFGDFVINLRPPEWPMKSMKLLMKKFNHSLDVAVASIDECTGLQMNCLKRQLTLNGTQKAYDALVTILKECVAADLPVAGIETPDCVVCLCPTDEKVYSLELCGHYYCRECVNNQLANAIREKQFPIVCVQNECSKPFVIKDFDQLHGGNADKDFDTKWQTLVDASLSDFVSKNKSDYSYCMTPDCHGVYKKSQSSQVFQCDICAFRQCSCCGLEFHAGVSCEMYERLKRDDNVSIDSWLRENPNNRKKCPKCKSAVEKNEGCMHMTCRICDVHFCWHCLFMADTSGKIYGHLTENH